MNNACAKISDNQREEIDEMYGDNETIPFSEFIEYYNDRSYWYNIKVKNIYDKEDEINNNIMISDNINNCLITDLKPYTKYEY